MKCTKCKKQKKKSEFYEGGYTRQCKDCIRERVSARRKLMVQNPEWQPIENARLRKWKSEHREQVKLVNKNWYRRVRFEALVAYGGKNPKCKCCGESTREFLCIDHLNGGGNAHRRELKLKGRGSNFFLWLKRQGFPKGFQVLCYNCNCAKGFNGQCPHIKNPKIVSL